MKPTLLLGTIIVAFAGFFGYYGVYLPQQAARAQVPLALQKEWSDQRAQADVASLLQRIEEYRRRLAPDSDASLLVNQVVSLANVAGVQLTRIVPESPRDVGGVTRLGVDLQFTSSYHQLGSFLDQIERAPTFIRVDRVEFSDAGGFNPSGQPSTQRPIHVVLSTLYVPPFSLADAPAGTSGPAGARPNS